MKNRIEKTKANISYGLAIFVIVCLFIICCCKCHSQTINVTNSVSTNSNEFYQPFVNIWQDVKGMTNVGVFPYASYSPKSGTTKAQIGGGIMAFYDVTKYVGTGVGVDYWGDWQMVSANIKLQLPTHPLASYGFTNITLTPLVIAGVGTPVSASSWGTAVSREGAGANIGLFRLWGGEFSVGGMYENYQGTTAIGRDIYHAWIGWSKGF